MAYNNNYKIINQPVSNGVYRLVGNDLRTLHDFALNTLKLSHNNFFDDGDSPYYAIPQSKALEATDRHGVKRLAATSHEAIAIKRELAIQLANNPGLGDSYSFSLAASADRAARA